MTANLKRFDPAGSDGATATATGNLTSVIIAGAGAVAYEADYGMSRGSNMGLRAVAPGTADQANCTFATTAAANGSGQVYGSFENWPTGGNQEFMTLRTSAGNCVRQLVSTAGSVIVQNQAGTTVATLGTISLNTPYRFELEATPNTTTSNGSARARIYDDSDTLVYDSGALTAGNYGGGLATKTVSVLRVGDPTTATTSAFAFGFTQPAIDTDATAPPTITPVSKSTGVSVTAVAPAITMAAVAPTVSAVRVAVALAVAATVAVAALAPTVDVDATISGGGPVGITIAAVAPTVSGVAHASVAATAGVVTVSALAPTVDVASVAAVAPPVIPITLQAVAPAVSAVAHRTVTAVAAAVTATAVPPSFSAGVSANTDMVAPGVTLAALAPTVASQLQPNVAAVAAAVVVTGQPPVVFGQRNPAGIAAPAPAITLAARAPVVSSQQQPTTEALVAEMWMAAIPPGDVTGVQSVDVQAVATGFDLAAIAPFAWATPPETPTYRTVRPRTNARSTRTIKARRGI